LGIWKKFLIVLLLFNLAYSKIITKEFLKNKPKSYAKDFYLYLYLKQNITPKDALWALSQAKNPYYKIFDEFAKKYKDKNVLKLINCKKYPPKRFLKEEPWCIEYGLSPYKATKLNRLDLIKIIKKLDSVDKEWSKKYKIIASNEPFLDLVKTDSKTFFKVFNNVGGKFRAKYFNHNLPLKLLKKLSKHKKQFSLMVKLIVTNPKLNKLKESLLNIKDTKKFDHFTIFFLAMNAIELDRLDIAKKLLKKAYKKAWYQFDVDKVLFWQYQVTKNKKYLEKLSNSWDVNIYSIYAKELTFKKFTNIYYNIPQSGKKSNFDITNQFAWLKVLKDIKKIDRKKLNKYKKIFSDNYTLGHLAFIYEKFFRYKKQFFVKPYSDVTKNLPLKRKALIYAIMRQESRYIPSSISISYAQGAMQIMPFLSRAIAKKLHKKYNILEQFNPKTNIEFANFHLNYLQKKLKHPLFIAYAYNGGIGFTKRILKTHFKHKKFEPFLSMELVPYSESRRYGKKVLANYWIYLNEKEKIPFNILLKNYN